MTHKSQAGYWGVNSDDRLDFPTMDQIPTFLPVVVFIILGVAGIAYLVSIVRRQSHRETRALADTRGERIDDLEEEVARLREKVDHLQGALEGYQRLKAEEIAVEVARLLEPRLA